MAKRKFTTDQKLSILKEAATHGVKVTLDKHDVYPATYYYWKRQLTEQGEEHFGKKSVLIKRVRSISLKRKIGSSRNSLPRRSFSSAPKKKIAGEKN